MANLGPFEILSELAKSPTGAVFKATDPESGQTVALKAIRLSAFGDHAVELEQALLNEAERAKVLSSSNITNVYGAGEIDGQFCAAMDYVQGNSIATMLARKEGFSIWDLLDIGRQLASGLDHASSQGVVHYSLEPAKIMCGWDGTVKILGFGVSGGGNFVQYVQESVPAILHYMSPEQIQGQTVDGRSNLFSLGAMFYEMVTERKAFDGDDAEFLRKSILGGMPVAPVLVNPKVHPLLSDLIMKLLAKDPAQRYQSGRQMLDDLEKCKEAKPLTAKKPEAPKGAISSKIQAATQSKVVAPPTAGRPTSAPATSAARPAPGNPAKPSTPARPSMLARPAGRLAAPKTAAAAASAGSGWPQPTSGQEVDLSNQFSANSTEPTEEPSAYMSAVDSPQVETFEAQDDGPTIKVDPMMAEGGQGAGAGTSFSDISELPPLKEVYVAPPAPPPPVYEPVAEAPKVPTVFQGRSKHDDKPKVQPREVAEKAIKEIKNVPPRLMLYALGGAGALILIILIGITYYVHTQNSDEEAGTRRPAAVAQAPAVTQTQPPEASQPAPPASEPAAAAPAAPEQTSEQAAPEEQPAATPVRASRRKNAAQPKMIIPGRLSVDSTPPGATVQLDGAGDPSWGVTPLTLTNVQPGQHSITVSKAGYASDSRMVQVTSGNVAQFVGHLSRLMATLVVTSDPAGANVYVDGHDTGTRTPAQVSVDKGQHVVLVRKMGYIDETTNAQFVLGQTFNYSPALRALGNGDNIHVVGGKFLKVFGGKGAQAGQAIISIRTQPKGAQVAINQRVMDKNSPVDIALDPGNYVVDITMMGYAPVHRVIIANRGDKVAVDEVLQQQ